MDSYRKLRHTLFNTLQSLLLLAAMGALLGFLGWIIAGAEGVLWTVSVGLTVLLLGPRLSPRLVLSMYGAREIVLAPAGELCRVIETLGRRAGLARAPRLFHLPTSALNAFTVGQRGEAAIALSDGLLRALTPRELVGVLAHEMSHVQNNDTWVLGLADLVSRLTAVLSLAGQILVLVFLPLMFLGHLELPLRMLAVLIAAPLASNLLQLALSRTREYDADLGAVYLTGDPQGLASALAKIETYQGGWVERLFLTGRRLPSAPAALRSHPPTAERVRRLLAITWKREGLFRQELPAIDYLRAVPKQERRRK